MMKKVKNNKSSNKEISFQEKLNLLKDSLPEGIEETLIPVGEKKTVEESLEKESKEVIKKDNSKYYPNIYTLTAKEREEAKYKEVWVALHGYEETHQISSMGRIRSRDHYITDKNGNIKLIRGRVYAIPVNSDYYKFNIEGKKINIVLSKSIGESFYNEEGDYSFINSFESFERIGKPELYASLQNVCNLKKKDKITIFNEVTNEEIVTNGNIVKLLSILNSMLPENATKYFSKWDLVSNCYFKIDEEFGIIISEMDKLPNIRLMIRNSSLYDFIIELRRKVLILDSGKFFEDEYLGTLWTGEELKRGILMTAMNHENKFWGYACAFRKLYVKNDIPIRPLSYYVIYKRVKKRKNDNSECNPFYRLISLNKLSLLDKINIPLSKEAQEKLGIINKKRK